MMSSVYVCWVFRLRHSCLQSKHFHSLSHLLSRHPQTITLGCCFFTKGYNVISGALYTDKDSL